MSSHYAMQIRQTDSNGVTDINFYLGENAPRLEKYGEHLIESLSQKGYHHLWVQIFDLATGDQVASVAII